MKLKKTSSAFFASFLALVSFGVAGCSWSHPPITATDLVKIMNVVKAEANNILESSGDKLSYYNSGINATKIGFDKFTDKDAITENNLHPVNASDDTNLKRQTYLGNTWNTKLISPAQNEITNAVIKKQKIAINGKNTSEPAYSGSNFKNIKFDAFAPNAFTVRLNNFLVKTLSAGQNSQNEKSPFWLFPGSVSDADKATTDAMGKIFIPFTYKDKNDNLNGIVDNIKTDDLKNNNQETDATTLTDGKLTSSTNHYYSYLNSNYLAYLPKSGNKYFWTKQKDNKDAVMFNTNLRILKVRYLVSISPSQSEFTKNATPVAFYVDIAYQLPETIL